MNVVVESIRGGSPLFAIFHVCVIARESERGKGKKTYFPSSVINHYNWHIIIRKNSSPCILWREEKGERKKFPLLRKVHVLGHYQVFYSIFLSVELNKNVMKQWDVTVTHSSRHQHCWNVLWYFLKNYSREGGTSLKIFH